MLFLLIQKKSTPYGLIYENDCKVKNQNSQILNFLDKIVIIDNIFFLGVYMQPQNVNQGEFERIIANQEGFILVDFWATWCAPCKAIAPLLEKVAEEQTNLTVLKVDVDQNNGLASKYRVRSIPTLLLIKDEEVIAQKSGAVNKVVLDSWLNAYLK